MTLTYHGRAKTEAQARTDAEDLAAKVEGGVIPNRTPGEVVVEAWSDEWVWTVDLVRDNMAGAT